MGRRFSAVLVPGVRGGVPGVPGGVSGRVPGVPGGVPGGFRVGFRLLQTPV